MIGEQPDRTERLIHRLVAECELADEIIDARRLAGVFQEGRDLVGRAGEGAPFGDDPSQSVGR